MSDVSAATAAPMPLTIGGKKYEFAPLRLRDFGKLEQFVRAKVIELGRDAAKGLPEKEARVIMRAAFDKAMAISFMAAGDEDPVVQRETIMILSSLDSMINIIYLSLLHEQPKITLAEVEDLIEHPDIELNEITQMIMTLSGQGGFLAKASLEKKKAQERQASESSSAQ